jgi:hypothetical protein
MANHHCALLDCEQPVVAISDLRGPNVLGGDATAWPILGVILNIVATLLPDWQLVVAKLIR